ncbi:unnamed protein product [Effrenium voratum]|uniref:Uncharacterized protein n=1 Tax=Effrenium voratum TaxID=2562239 RepID=A0AA36IWU0_9DINO|nr:unnamed protein product [Effrenium voratum]
MAVANSAAARYVAAWRTVVPAEGKQVDFVKGLVEGTCLREGDEDRVDKDALCSENATLVAESLKVAEELGTVPNLDVLEMAIFELFPQDPSMGRAQAVALKIGLQHVVRLKKRAPTTRKGTWLAALKECVGPNLMQKKFTRNKPAAGAGDHDNPAVSVPPPRQLERLDGDPLAPAADAGAALRQDAPVPGQTGGPGEEQKAEGGQDVGGAAGKMVSKDEQVDDVVAGKDEKGGQVAVVVAGKGKKVGDAVAGKGEQVGDAAAGNKEQVGDAAAAAKSRIKKASGVHAGAESKKVSKGGQVGGAGSAHAKDNEDEDSIEEVFDNEDKKEDLVPNPETKKPRKASEGPMQQAFYEFVRKAAESGVKRPVAMALWRQSAVRQIIMESLPEAERKRRRYI